MGSFLHSSSQPFTKSYNYLVIVITCLFNEQLNHPLLPRMISCTVYYDYAVFVLTLLVLLKLYRYVYFCDFSKFEEKWNIIIIYYFYIAAAFSKLKRGNFRGGHVVSIRSYSFILFIIIINTVMTWSMSTYVFSFFKLRDWLLVKNILKNNLSE